MYPCSLVFARRKNGKHDHCGAKPIHNLDVNDLVFAHYVTLPGAARLVGVFDSGRFAAHAALPAQNSAE
jgi:hypothetical protein